MSDSISATSKAEQILDAEWKELTGGAEQRQEWFDLAAPREMSVVSYAMTFPDLVDDLPFLSSKHFLVPKMGKVWASIVGLRAEGQPITMAPITRASGLSPKELLALMQAGMAFGIMKSNVPVYAEEIVRSWHMLQVSSAASKAMGGAGSVDMREIANAVDRAREELSSLTDTRRPRNVGQSSLDLLTEIAQRVDGAPTGATTGLRDLDEIMGGLKPGTLNIIAGRPGMGKSVLAGSIARQTAAAGNGTFFLSMELSGEMQAARFMADQALTVGSAHISYEDISRGNLPRDKQRRVEAAAVDLERYPLVMSDKTNLLVSEIRAMTKDVAHDMERNGGKLSVLVLDYLKFIKASDRYAGQRVNEIGEITGALKGMAKEMGLAIILVCQLNRQNEQREDKRPQLSDLRESGDIEQDADVVMFVYRDEYYARRETDEQKRSTRLLQCRNVLEILVEKNRHGRTDTVKVWCDVSASAVRDLENRR